VTESTWTTPHVEADSATELSSGMKASLLSFATRGSLAMRFSALDFVSISRYRGELQSGQQLSRAVGKATYFNAKAMMDVGSSVRTTMEASLKMCSGSAMRSSTSLSDLNLDCGACPGQKPVNARKIEFLSLAPVSVSVGTYEVCGRVRMGSGLVNTVGDVEAEGSADSAASLTVRSGVVTGIPVGFVQHLVKAALRLPPSLRGSR
jgi:hypothetical protein